MIGDEQKPDLFSTKTVSELDATPTVPTPPGHFILEHSYVQVEDFKRSDRGRITIADPYTGEVIARFVLDRNRSRKGERVLIAFTMRSSVEKKKR